MSNNFTLFFKCQKVKTYKTLSGARNGWKKIYKKSVNNNDQSGDVHCYQIFDSNGWCFAPYKF